MTFIQGLDSVSPFFILYHSIYKPCHRHLSTIHSVYLSIAESDVNPILTNRCTIFQMTFQQKYLCLTRPRSTCVNCDAGFLPPRPSMNSVQRSYSVRGHGLRLDAAVLARFCNPATTASMFSSSPPAPPIAATTPAGVRPTRIAADAPILLMFVLTITKFLCIQVQSAA